MDDAYLLGMADHRRVHGFSSQVDKTLGVMTFAEWNETRYGKNKTTRFMARLAAAAFCCC